MTVASLKLRLRERLWFSDFSNINFSSRRIRRIDVLEWVIICLPPRPIRIEHFYSSFFIWIRLVKRGGSKTFLFWWFYTNETFWSKIDDLENFKKTEDRLEGQTYFLSSQNAEKCRKMTERVKIIVQRKLNCDFIKNSIHKNSSSGTIGHFWPSVKIFRPVLPRYSTMTIFLNL